MYEQGWIDERRTKRMSKVDAMPPDVRALVYEYGLNVVNALMECGVKEPRRIKHIVETVLDEFSPTRGSKSRQGPRSPMDPSEVNP